MPTTASALAPARSLWELRAAPSNVPSLGQQIRQQFGLPIAQFQGLQWMLQQMQTQLTASRLMLYAAAASRGPNGSPFPDPELAAQAKIFASEAAIKIVNDALQLFGAPRIFSRLSDRTHGPRRANVYDRRWHSTGTADPRGIEDPRTETPADP